MLLPATRAGRWRAECPIGTVASTSTQTRPISAEGERARAPRQDFRRDIQGLRALAVLLVIANHAGIPGFAGGYIGVDVFFVISGYVITQLLLREADKGVRLGLADFYSRRVRRIVPAATATLVGTIAIAAVLIGPRLNPNLPGDIRWASLFSANFRFIETGSNYFVPGIFPSLITQFWSLAVEEQFYLFFPLAVFLVAAYTHPGRRLAVLRVVLVVTIALSAWWSIHFSPGNPTPAYYSPLTRFWELGLGCLLATITTGRLTRTPRSERIAVGLGIALLVLALATLSPQSVYPGSAAWLPCGATALVIWAGASGNRTAIAKLLSLGPLVYLGDISYSLYLTHYAWLNIPQQLAAPLEGWGWRILELIGTLVSAVASYHLLENPIRRSRRLAADRIAIVLVLLVCIAASWTASIVVTHALHLS